MVQRLNNNKIENTVLNNTKSVLCFNISFLYLKHTRVSIIISAFDSYIFFCFHLKTSFLHSVIPNKILVVLRRCFSILLNRVTYY